MRVRLDALEITFNELPGFTLLGMINSENRFGSRRSRSVTHNRNQLTVIGSGQTLAFAAKQKDRRAAVSPKSDRFCVWQLNRHLEIAGRPESDSLTCFEFDRFAGCRIGFHPGCTISNCKMPRPAIRTRFMSAAPAFMMISAWAFAFLCQMHPQREIRRTRRPVLSCCPGSVNRGGRWRRYSTA
jgi:hypothetical protein